MTTQPARWQGFTVLAYPPVQTTMRIGVSAKIFLAYAVLLSVFGANSLFTLLYLHRGRQELAANQRRLEVQVAVDAALRSLEDFSRSRANDSTGIARGLTSRVAAQNGIASARQNLSDALVSVDQYLTDEPNPRRRNEFEDYRREIVGMEARVVAVAADLGASDPTAGEDASRQAERSLANLLSTFHRLKSNLRGRGSQVAAELSNNERRAVDAAMLLTGLGLLLAVAAALLVLRTLWPLRVLREHARQIAGGDYARRTGVRSHDEIGDLAREFNAMAHAIEEREHKLIRSERLATVGRMAAHITHEIRNPLASVGLYLELLSDEIGADKPEARNLVKSLSNEVDRLSEITETYLRFVRLPKPKLDREDLGALASSVMEFSRGELALAHIDLDLAIASGLPEVAADESQIRQALLNLVRNAKEAMPEGGRIQVEVGVVDSGWVRLAVGDSGSGISPENLGKIFDPFFSTKDKGTGLGLALVQQIVTDHGGRIEVELPPTGGTTFAILLPPAARAALAPPGSLSETNRGSGKDVVP
jgi:signal transduction histidine kinase